MLGIENLDLENLDMRWWERISPYDFVHMSCPISITPLHIGVSPRMRMVEAGPVNLGNY